jgi:hypothetical protein
MRHSRMTRTVASPVALMMDGRFFTNPRRTKAELKIMASVIVVDILFSFSRLLSIAFLLYCGQYTMAIWKLQAFLQAISRFWKIGLVGGFSRLSVPLKL